MQESLWNNLGISIERWPSESHDHFPRNYNAVQKEKEKYVPYKILVQ